MIPPAYLSEPDAAPVVALPWSAESEQSVLGALLLDNTSLDRVSGLLREASFWHAAHRTIWTAITAQIAAHKPADVITVFEALRSNGEADQCGGMAYLNDLAQSVPGSSNIRRYAEIVAEKASQRAVLTAADEALTIAKGAGLVADKLDRIDAAFSGVQRDQMTKAPRRLSDLLLGAIDRYTELADGKAITGWATGITPLDRMLNGGLKPGKVYGLAARPSVGKSSAARAIGLHAASLGYPVLLLSQEMPADEVADCAVSQLGRIDGSRLQTGELDAGDWTRLTDAVESASQLPFHIDDEGGLTIGDIRAKARMVKGLKVLLVDYLQLSASTLKGASTNDQIAEITKGLKQLALQMGIAIVLLSQLNRDVEKRADKEPQLSDLRDSGAIEQDIDVAIMLWTAKEPEDGGSSRLVGWKIAKHRGGKKGIFGMRFDAAIYHWAESFEQLKSAPEQASRNTKGFRE